MNAVEIEEAVSKLAEAPFDAETFPFAFLEAFGNKPTTLKRLKTGNTNQSDLPGGLLQRNNIHLAVSPAGAVTATLASLRQSPATTRQKAKFILATDGHSFEAENLIDGETVACAFADFHDHFGFFLPLAGITTVKQIRENAFDIKATGRLNRLYVELLRENAEWDTAGRREELNHFFARLIFCFFAEDTGIFMGSGLFTDTLQQMTASDSSNTHEVLSELFRAMNTKPDEREATNLRNWAKSFPYVNGGLFSDSVEVPRFTRIARSYLLHIGSLDWTRINPDIFGSMIQAVADDEERGALGMHYTSVPNILKVLNPLFLDDLRAKLAEATDENTNQNTSLTRKRSNGDDHNTSPKRERAEDISLKRKRRSDNSSPPRQQGNVDNISLTRERSNDLMREQSNDNTSLTRERRSEQSDDNDNDDSNDDISLTRKRSNDPPLTPGASRKLLNLRNRIARIRVFDPACGSGNFLVIAYKEMRAIEAEINRRRGEAHRRSEIPLTNFRGIELRHFSVEIARLALIIAEYQCDVLYRGEKLALAEFLPLEAANWITCGNALRLDWLAICPPTGTGVKLRADDLFSTPLDQAEMDFENEGGETYLCGNPPYKGSQDQTPDQKQDLEFAFQGRIGSARSADYVSGWFIRGRDYISKVPAKFAFVATNSINQGRQVALYWPAILEDDLEICFAVPSFQWRNLAAKAAIVTVSIVGVSRRTSEPKLIYSGDTVKTVGYIGPYLVPDCDEIVEPRNDVLSKLGEMDFGSMPNDGGYLLMVPAERDSFVISAPEGVRYLRKFIGSDDALYGKFRYCLWITDAEAAAASEISVIRDRVRRVEAHRLKSTRPATNRLATRSHAFGEVRYRSSVSLLIPRHSSEDRQYLPFDLVGPDVVVADSAIALPNAQLFEAAVFASRMHLVWVSTVCGKLETRYRYSNTLGWNTFPVPTLTDQNRADLTRSAENILLAREAHFPATIADLYDPDAMPADLRAAHDHNDEILERIYIGRRFKNDTERLEKLFEMYTAMTTRDTPPKKPSRRKKNSG